MSEPSWPHVAVSRDDAAAMLEPLTELVIRAGAAILAVDRGVMNVDGKSDGSPLTEADLAADRVIADGLAALYPDIPALSEERASLGRPVQGSFFLVDPLDGTKEFVAGHAEFTVNVALVTDGEPVLGIVGAPALGLCWRGVAGHGAQRLTLAPPRRAEPIRSRSLPPIGQNWVAAVSRSHGDPRTDAFIAARPNAERKMLGSAIKFCRVAEGAADIYPRLAPTCEWDIAAGHAVLTAAGGKVTDGRGMAIRFDEPRADFRVPEFIAWGDPRGQV